MPSASKPTRTRSRSSKGRGERIQLNHRSGPFTLIDESYNANPASTRAALALLSQSKPEGRGRRIAVLGDMLELGATASTLHQGLLPAVRESGADAVFLTGPLMKGLWEGLPEHLRGAYAASAGELEPILREAIGPGDAAMDDQFGHGAPHRRRLLDAVAREAGGEDQAPDRGMAADDAVLVEGVVLVVARPQHRNKHS